MSQQQRTQSWHTRMASVMRQFRKLADERVVEESTGNAIQVIGIGIAAGKVRLTVDPMEGGGPFYSLDLEEIESE